LSRTREVDFQQVILAFGLERFLYRLSRSVHAKKFILKGALLFTLRGLPESRPTSDIDLLGYGDSDPDVLARIFREICLVPGGDDGVVFDPQSVTAVPIRGVMDYGGVRTTLRGGLSGARLMVQVDVGFGDMVFPAPEYALYPTLLDLPAPRLRVYPWETQIAEKLQAMVKLGIANSRMKDFYDLWIIAHQFDFDCVVLAESIEKTFRRRQTPLPLTAPFALTPEFWDDNHKKKEWMAFLKRTKLRAPDSLGEVAEFLAVFLLPPLRALMKKNGLDQEWKGGGPWRRESRRFT
jgi:hypothetical protein